MKQFNIRVYGLLINENREILLSDEERKGFRFTKFPGGGLEWGEGLIEALKREFREELRLEIEVGELFYLTDYFQLSAFSSNDQLISVYYLVYCQEPEKITTKKGLSFEKKETHRWRKISELKPEELTFPIDCLVAQKLRENQ